MQNGEWQFVKKSEYQPVRLVFEGYIKQVQKILRKEGLTFQFHLIGSGRRKMITYRVGDNKGYDFDYNLELMSWPEGCTAKQVKDMIRDTFRKVLKSTRYKDPEDSTSVLTVKLVDPKKSRIDHSFDMAIVIYNSDGLNYLHRDGIHYEFRQRGYRFDDREYLEKIKERRSDGYQLVCEEYLKLKNNNRDPNKRSFNLYNEAVMNVYNQVVNGVVCISSWIEGYRRS